MAHVPEIDVHAAASAPAQTCLLDVREPAEYRAGHIPGARHIPMAQVPARLDELPAGTEVIVVCKVGARSAQVTAFLHGRGHRARNLVGGMLAWAAAELPMRSEDGRPPRIG